MDKNIEDYLKIAEENLHKAEKFREKIGNPGHYLDSRYSDRLLIVGIYHATLANYYASRALIEALSEKK